MTRINPRLGSSFNASKKLRLIRDYEEGKDISAYMAKENISYEELMGWVRHFKVMGYDGLKIANLQAVRKMEATVEQL